MFRLFPRSAFTRPLLSGNNLSRTSVARAFLGVSGTLYCISAARTIHSDSNGEHERAPHQKTPFQMIGPFKLFESYTNRGFNEDLLLDTTTTFPPHKGTGVTRYDVIVVPRYASKRTLSANNPSSTPVTTPQKTIYPVVCVNCRATHGVCSQFLMGTTVLRRALSFPKTSSKPWWALSQISSQSMSQYLMNTPNWERNLDVLIRPPRP